VELMITVSIIDLRLAVTIAQLMNARYRANGKAKAGELVGITWECASFTAEANGTTTAIKSPSGDAIVCGGDTPQSSSWPVALGTLQRHSRAPAKRLKRH
jgi:hypothetical protein